MAKITDAASVRVRRWATLAILVVGSSAAVLSWTGLTALGHQAGWGRFAVLFPVVVDGAMLMGALSVLRSNVTGTSPAWGWAMTLSGAAISVWGNVIAAGPAPLAVHIVHAIPPVALAASVEALMREIRHEITRPVKARAARRNRAEATPAPADAQPQAQVTPVPAQTSVQGRPGQSGAGAGLSVIETPRPSRQEQVELELQEILGWLGELPDASVVGASEIASQFGLSETTARRRLQAAREKEPALFGIDEQEASA